MSESKVWLTGAGVLLAVFAVSVAAQCHGRVGSCFYIGMNPSEPERQETTDSAPHRTWKCTAFEWTNGDSR